MAGGNKNGKKSNTLLIVSIIVLCIAILIPSTLAWFTDQRDLESTVEFGMIKIDDKSNYNGTAIVNALPGTSFASDQDCSVALATGSQPVFIRAKITVSYTQRTASVRKENELGVKVDVPYDDMNAAMNVFVAELNTLLTSKIKTATEEGRNYYWQAHNGYYYLVSTGTGGNATPLKVGSTAITYVFVDKDDMVIPVELTNPSTVVDGKKVKNLQFEEQLNIQLIFEGVQADNLQSPSSAAGSETEYNPAAPTVKAIEQFFDPNATPNQPIPVE